MRLNALILLTVLGSLSVVGLSEFCWPRRRRKFPAIRRRSANLSFWIVNLFLAACLFPAQSAVRSQLQAIGINFAYVAVR